MLSVARLVSFWRCIPMQYNCQKSSNFQGLSHFSRIFGKNDKIPGFFQAGKTVTIFPGFPGAVGTLFIDDGLITLNPLIPLCSEINMLVLDICTQITEKRIYILLQHIMFCNSHEVNICLQ